MSRLAVAAFGLWALAACKPRTEIVLGFATDYEAPVPLDEIQLDVIRQDGFPEGGDGLSWSISGAPDAPYNLPASYGIYSDGEDVQLDVSLTGFSQGSAIVEQTVTLSLVSGQTLFYRMGLTAECESVTCPTTMTCMEGTCVDPTVPVLQLPAYTEDLVTTLTCIPPAVHYAQTAGGGDMPYSADAASCPPDLCVQGLCLNPPGGGGSNGPSADTYLKPGYVSGSAAYGDALAVSADGNTVVVGGPLDSLGGTGVDPDEGSPTALSRAGGVYVFERAGSASPWTQSAYVKASNADASDEFGAAVAISGDGNTIAITADGESSDATGIDGDQGDNSDADSGAVYVFARAGGTWTQAAYIKPQYDIPSGFFGWSVALSNDGSTLAVGEERDPNSAPGIDSTPVDDGISRGSVYVFALAGSAWSQQAYIRPAVSHDDDQFGISVALSGDGNTLAVGALGESSSARGVGSGLGSDGSDTSDSDAGAAYVFARAGSAWAQSAYVKASNTQSEAQFGAAVALSGSGDALVVGAPGESSSAVGLDGNQSDTSEPYSGAAYLFTLSGGAWSQQHYIKASNTGADTQFGHAVAISPDGAALLIGSPYESSAATGLDGSQTSTGAPSSGAAYLFASSGGTWSQLHYVKASNTRAMANFGASTAVANAGATYSVGAPGDSSDATGVDGDQSSSSAPGEGAVYVFPVQ